MNKIIDFFKRKYRKVRYGTELTEEDMVEGFANVEDAAEAMRKFSREFGESIGDEDD